MIDRRAFLAGLAVAPLASRVRAMVLGDATLTTISDGTLVLPTSLPQGVQANELADLVARFGLSEAARTPRPLNVTLWQTGDRTVLIDAGSGGQFLPTAGELYANLEAAGVAPEDVTDVVFTHGHPDHLWGILDDFDEIAFPDAALHIGQAELDYWSDPATFETLPEAIQMFAVGAERRIEAMTGALDTFGDDDEVLPGLFAVPTPGHTPGHMSFRVESGGEAAMVIGDAAVNAHLNFARPGWPSASDQDPDLAARTRTHLLGELADTGMLTVGYHLPGDGFGRVEQDGGGFRFVPENS